MDPSEVEFLAEKEMVKIIPNFSLDKIYLIGVSKAKYSCVNLSCCVKNLHNKTDKKKPRYFFIL